MIGVEFLQRFYPAAATTLPLCSIDRLPSLVVLLFSAVAAVCKIENHGNQERFRMFQHDVPSTALGDCIVSARAYHLQHTR